MWGEQATYRDADRGWSVTNGTGRDRIRVCLVDDHALIRQALRDRFAREPDIEVVGEAATAQSALALVGSVQPDVAVLDRQVLELVGDGLTDRQIAQRLDEPVEAAKGEVRSLLGKLGWPGGRAAGTSGGLAAKGV